MAVLIECVPNFSEGVDMSIIEQITSEIKSVEGVQLLDVDPGKSTNRTVVTFAGEPEPVIEAAFLAISKASELIDMSLHSGEHPRFGATDVCPLVPISGITVDELVPYAERLGERVGRELDIPVYLYEAASKADHRRNLADIRAGEYEGIAQKIQKPEWQPDFGPTKFNPRSGNIAIGARGFLVAFNVNLNTTSVRRANSVAFDVREKGRIKREGDPINGKIVRDEQGNAVRIPGICKAVKGIGWFIEEYGLAQISMNLTDIETTPVHIAFDECVNSAARRGMRVTGSELVGLIPLKSMLEAGRYFLKKQKRSTGVPNDELIRIAVKTMGLDELAPFDPAENIIEYKLRNSGLGLVDMQLKAFAEETASESPAPGGGSISAYVGALGVSLGTMVANLSSHKRGWDDRWEEFSDWAEKGQQLSDRLLSLVDADTAAFNKIMAAMQLPKKSDQEKLVRSAALNAATVEAIEVPFEVMQVCMQSRELITFMANSGNPNSVSDAGVGALCIRAAVHGAFLNVQINVGGLDDKAYVERKLAEGKEMLESIDAWEQEVLQVVRAKV